jgi:hypothetical protein
MAESVVGIAVGVKEIERWVGVTTTKRAVGATVGEALGTEVGSGWADTADGVAVVAVSVAVPVALGVGVGLGL